MIEKFRADYLVSVNTQHCLISITDEMVMFETIGEVAVIVPDTSRILEGWRHRHRSRRIGCCG